VGLMHKPTKIELKEEDKCSRNLL